jgi:hypothetical protein
MIGILAASLCVVACDLGGTIGGGSGMPVPTIAAHTQPTPTRPALLIQYCDDDTGSYPRQYFCGANQLMASSLEQAITANQNGITLYATAITHNTFDPANTLTPAFSIPAIQAYPVPPTPYPTPVPQGPVTDPPTETAVAKQNDQAIINYNQSVAAINQKIQQAQAAAKHDGGRLTVWDPPVDTSGTSILGCFQLAASRFAGQSDMKMIYIASDLENNTDVDYTQSFVTDHRLAGVIVHVIYLYSQSASQDSAKRAQWCRYLQAAGATAVIYSDAGSSANLPDAVDSDLKVPSRACP